MLAAKCAQAGWENVIYCRSVPTIIGTSRPAPAAQVAEESPSAAAAANYDRRIWTVPHRRAGQLADDGGRLGLDIYAIEQR